MDDIHGASVLLTSFLSGGTSPLELSSVTKLEAKVVTEENWRQAQNTGTAEDQQPPPPSLAPLNQA